MIRLNEVVRLHEANKLRIKSNILLNRDILSFFITVIC